MAKYSAYYDASGSENDEGPLVVVGLIAALPKWYRFDNAWRRALADFKAPYVHMREFTASKGPFASWKADEKRRSAFLERLTGIIGSFVEHAIVFRMLPTDFRHVDQRYQLSTDLCPTPYPFAAYRCVTLIEQWLWSRHSQAELGHVLEEGDFGQGPMADLVRRGVTHLTIASKFDIQANDYVTPLQAADLVAYECRLAISRHLAEEKRAPRKSLLALHGALSMNAVKMGQRDLYALCRAHPNLYPKRQEESLGSE